ncbi:MFS general substrate transporter [Apiospora aurea]|uniref:MFS general substrate transporter n=1 Tax=Apiospora aurea TaxID=335848 RepID=A0ABR1PWT7_9PEZI
MTTKRPDLRHSVVAVAVDEEPDAERRPLLSRSSSSGTPPSAKRLARTPRLQVYLLFAVVAGLDSTIFMLSLPLTRVYESITCYQWYAVEQPGVYPDPHSVPEDMCKIGPVQEKLAMMRGLEFFFMAAPGSLNSPKHRTANQWGRRPVLRLCVLGLVAAVTEVLLVCQLWRFVPLQFVWVGWLLTFVGGGAAVLNSTVFAMLAEMVEEKDRATVFLQLNIAILTAQLISTPTTAALMARFGATVPIVFGFSVGILSSILALLVPETRSSRPICKPGEVLGVDTSPSEPPPETDKSGALSVIFQTLSRVGSLFRSPALLALLGTLFIDTFTSTTSVFVVQYISAKFALTIAAAGSLITIKAIVAIVFFLVLVPAAKSSLQGRWYLSPKTSDLWLARAMIACSPVGLVLMALSPNLVIMAAGMVLVALSGGSTSPVRSVATGLVEPSQLSLLYGVINVTQGVATLVAAPLLSELFGVGLRWGAGWVALPFAVAAALSLVSCLAIWLIKP